MLLEVNLLPEKEKRDMTNLLIIGIVAFVIIAMLLTFRFMHDDLTTDVRTMEQEIMEVKILSAEIQSSQVVSEVDRLTTTLETLENHVIPASTLLDYLVALLPERGFFLNFDYQLSGEVNFDASFDQIEQIAAYNQVLTISPIVRDVVISNISADALMDEETIEESEFLPRYVASFKLMINSPEVKKLGQGEDEEQ
ncbi:hypothetical protein [Bacillus alkalicellulosilyticus]|uniref:hypothetical protein n=1 Tax=Alkalihalobacterium alkalicellulosilyticum TaxID=1912214 RepID=UPI000997F244|nr:hypothetical protein [Bacillus alkalicellulosilyticus]